MNTSTVATILIALMILVILWNLAAGLYYLIKDQGKTKRTVRALTWRISLSFILFFALLIAFALGWITPHSLLGP